MKIIIAILALLPTVASAANCSKKIAEEKVNAICKTIESKGAQAKSDWPAALLFQNCGDNYIWVQDTDAPITMIMHPIKQRLNGTSIKDQIDENKFPLFVEFDKAAKAKPAGAWVDYMWAKPGAEKAGPKTSYVKMCNGKDGTKWIAGSGVWKEDLK